MTASLLRDTFEGIPVDILLEVAKYLEATDMLSLRAVSVWGSLHVRRTDG
jgi:hypothetical protein